MEPRELVEVALAAARAAVEVHRRHVGSVGTEAWAEKGHADFASHVDEEAEAAAVRVIRERCPGHDILAEEAAGSAVEALAAADWLWIVDPLDGTTNYLHRYPAYAASVAAARRGEVVAGAVVSGVTGEAWSACLGGGAYLDGRPIRVSEIGNPRHALIGTGFPFRQPELLPGYLRQFQAVLPNVSGIRRAGSAALDLCHVATGYLDAFWELVLAPWDIAAGALIVREAGGVITTIGGDPDVFADGSVLAGNPAMHRELARLLASAGAGETPRAGAV